MATSAARSCACPGAKEGRALATPLVQRRRVLLRNCREQRACQYIWVDRIGSRRLDQFAELLHLALLQQLRPFVQCFQFRVAIPHLSHLASPFYVSMQARRSEGHTSELQSLMRHLCAAICSTTYNNRLL